MPCSGHLTTKAIVPTTRSFSNIRLRLFALATVLFLAACGETDPEMTAPPHQAAALPTPSFSIATPTGVLAGPILNPANGHQYYLLNQDTWTNSEAGAIALGGHLVTINDLAENEWVFTTFSSYGGVSRSLWIGFTDQAVEGAFVWTSGENPGYTNWSAGQPNNGISAPRGPESFAHFWSPDFIAAYGFPPGTWNDYVDLNTVDGTPVQGVVEVSNQAPVVGSIALPPSPVQVMQSVTISASFTDVDLNGLHTATIDWGDDGPASPGVVSETPGSGTVSSQHSYSTAGVYTITVTVSDGLLAGQRTSTSDVPAYTVVYDPSGGFVTGGGWITSPAGACSWSGCRADGSSAGKATFGFVSGYKKGATVPTGNTEFQFQAGGLNFSSASYEWLVVAGSKAQFKGQGTINGVGVYKFMLWGGAGTPNTFRIRITGAGDGVVYDNGVDQPLGGGSIVIHQ